MSLISPNYNPNQDLTIEQRQALTSAAMRKSINRLFSQMVAVYLDNNRMVFDNPFNLTKDQVIAGFGQDAVELIRVATLLRDVINLIQPGTLPIDPINEYNAPSVVLFASGLIRR
jgi:hypothetical protein